MAEKLKFEDALAKLERIVADIEEGEVSLEESIEKYAEGIELIKQCRTILDAAEEKIRVLTRGEDGELEADGELDEDGEESNTDEDA